MEFDFNINYLFNDTITKLDNRVNPFRRNVNGYDYATLRKQLFQVIDHMGDASARAQGLRGTITTARKLELSDHILYVIKDTEANNGKGAVVGILKIGSKKLFVYDARGQQHEMAPLCVLDFYVHESRQRMGCGKKLFEYFLKDQNINPKHLAIDKPSFKFSSFLHKHYNLKAVVPQVNNFVVFEGFFNNRPDLQDRGMGRPPSHPSRNQYHYRQDRRSPEGDIVIRRPNGVNSAQWYIHERPPSGKYSRQDRPPSGKYSRQDRPPSGRYSKQERPPSGRFSKMPPQSYPSRNEEEHLNMPNRPPSGTDPYNVALNERLTPQLDLQQVSAERAMGAKANQYSRHGNTPPGSRPSSNTQPSNMTNNDRAINRNHNNDRPDSPPLLQRNPPPRDYTDKLNLHQDYQGRSGHLNYNPDSQVGSLPHIIKRQSPNPSTGSYYSNSPSWRSRTDYNWTVGQVQNHQTISQRHYTHTRLW